jgi:hypothetical protein
MYSSNKRQAKYIVLMLNFDEQSNDDNNSNSSVEPGKFKSFVSLDFVTLAVIFKDYSSQWRIHQ